MKKIFSLFAAMLVAIAVSAQTDFSTPYSCTADDGAITGTAPSNKVYLNSTADPHQIEWSDVSKSYTAVVQWEVEATRGCYVSVSLDLGTAVSSNKHIFQVKILDAKGNERGYVEEAAAYSFDGYTDKETVKALDGTILLPTAGVYTIELRNNRDYCKGSIRNVILTYAADAPAEIIDVTSVEINKTELALQLEEVEQLTATVLPDNATDPTVTWSSSDEAVATVSENGFVTAIAIGTADIKAKAGDVEAICEVTVSAVSVPEVALTSTYTLAAKTAQLEGKIWKKYEDDSYKLYGDGGHNAHYGNALWTINVTNPCIISGTIAGIGGGSLFELDVFKGEDSITTIIQPTGSKWWSGNVDMEGTITLAEAGEYTFRLRNTLEWSSGKTTGVILSYESDLPKTIYCKVEQSWWTSGNAAVGLYAWGEGVEQIAEWPGVRMTKVEGQAGLWSYELPAKYTSVIFTRINPSNEGDLYWGAKTENLAIPTDDNDMYIITTASETWDPATVAGEWSKFVPEVPAKFYITGTGNLVGSELAWNPAAIKVTEDSYTFENLAVGDYMMKITDGAWNANTKGYDALTAPIADGITRGEGANDGNICFTLAEAGNVTVTYTGEVFKVEGNFYVAPVEDPAKFYITGNASLVGADKAWHSDAIKVTEDTYIFENLPASYYQLKVSVDGTWSNTKGFSDLTGTVADGLSADGDNNICFKLDKAGDVTVTYTGEVFKVEGNFWVQRLHNGFYLVGAFNGVEKWDAASLTAGDEFEWNKNIGEGNDEWKITVALTAGDKFKAVYVYEDEITTWYPDGSDNEYLVNADHAGAEKTIFFQEKHNYEWGGHFYVESNGGSTAVDNTEDGVTAKKVVENGMLIIEKNNVRYTVTGQVIR